MVRVWRGAVLAVVFIAGSAACSAGTCAAETINLTYKPAIGSKWISHTELLEVRRQDGKEPDTLVVREKAECKIDSEFPGGFRTICTPVAGHVEGNNALNGVTSLLMKALEGTPVIIDTNARGVPVQIANIAEVKDKVIATIDSLLKDATTKPKSGDLVKLLTALRLRYDGMGPDTSTVELLNTMRMQTEVQGLGTVTVGEEMAFSASVSTPLTTDKVRAQNRVKVTSIDQKSGMAIVTWKQKIDEEEFARALTESVKRLKPDTSDESAALLASMAQSQLGVADSATYYIAVADGTVRYMERTEAVRGEDYSNVKKTTVSLQPAP